jgi:integrase
MPSYRLTLWKETKPGTAERPVYLVIQHGRGKRSTLFTGVRVNPSDWNDAKTEVRRSRKNASKLNRRLRAVEVAAADVIDEVVAAGAPVTPREIRDRIAAIIDPEPEEVKDEAPADFLVFMEGWVEEYENAGQASTHKAYRTAFRKLRDFAKGPLPYELLTPAYIKAWGKHLEAPEPHGKGHKRNYVRKVLTSTRTAIRDAVKREDPPEGFRDPFELLEGDPLLRTERVVKHRLTAEEVAALAAAPAEPGSLVEAYRDAFVFSFFCGGLRFGDLCLLKWTDFERDGEGRPVRLVFRAEKTKKRGAVPVISQAAAVLERYEGRRGLNGKPSPYVFPFLDGRDVSTPAKRRSVIGSRNAYGNGALKKLARRAKVKDPDKVTFHIARHSLAAHLVDSGVPVHGIKEFYQHSSVRVTESYLAGFDRGLLDDAYRNAFVSEPTESGGRKMGDGHDDPGK